MKVKFYLLLLLSLCIIYPASSQVVINEISASNFAGGGNIDNYGEYEDWIELYNTGSAGVDISGYFLSDNEAEPMKWQIPAGVSVPPTSYLLIYASGLDEMSGGNLHTSFKITQAKQEGAVLSNPSGTIIDSYILTTPVQCNHSRGRTSDGANTWGIFLNPTPGAANVDPQSEYTTVAIDTDAGSFTGSVSVTMSSTDPNAIIHYTLNGFVPTETSPVYSGPVNLTQTAVVRARSFDPDPYVPPSFIATNTYFVNTTHTVPIISVSGDEIETLLNGMQIEPVGHLEYFDENGVMVAEASGDFNEHGNDSWAYDQRGMDYITQDEFGYGNEIHYQIFPGKERDGFQRLILKCGASDNYPFEEGGAHIRDAFVQSLSQMADLRLDERTYEPCVLYVNGQYWGVYDIREKVDDLDFTDYYYDQGAGDVDFIKTWGGTWVEYGSDADFNTLRDFILNNDMSDQANYDYVKNLYNTGSLIDYFLLNSYVVCADWLNWNTAWWRGRNPDGDKKKWRYVLWDMDATFGHYINYTNIPDQSPNADPCNPEQLGNPGGQGHVPIWNALLNNDEFFADYINRYSDLSGSYFSCEFMHHHLDSLIALIEPEMPQQIARWGGTMAEWHQNAQDIYDFIDERCAVINDGFLDCYPELDGPFEVTYYADPPQAGRIDLPTMEISEYPFTGTYFGGINVDLDADENPGFVFSHWSSNSTAFSPDDTSEEVVVSFTANDTLIAHFVPEVDYQLTLNVYPPNTGTITLNGTEYTNFPVAVNVPGSTLIEASAEAVQGWGFDFWTPTVVLNEPAIQDTVTFTLDANGNLTANFFEIIYDVTFDVSPPGVASISVFGVDLPELPATETLQGNAPIDISTHATTPFFVFSHWNTLSAVPLPDENSADVQMTFTGPDIVVANYVELPHFPLTIDTKPRDVGWVALTDTTIHTFPFTAEYIADEDMTIEAIDRGKYAFDHWEVVYGLPFINVEAPFQHYNFVSPTKIIAHFKERFNSVYIPNSFTPNGDGTNDIFKVYSNEIDPEDYRFSVMNRWGQELFYTENPNAGWNGTGINKNYLVPPGVYTYFIRYVNLVSDQIIETAGTIVLIR